MLWKINWNYKVIIKSILSALIMSSIVIYLKEMFPISVGHLFLLVGIGFFSYLISIILMKLFSPKEISYIKKIVTNQSQK